ncbi:MULTISPECIES: LysR family transcriptional regulator [unclassified Duganella]|uniref:LysR family transcriptional regulator n=1 Tax=unclassified Duganella TaxID=2636909 RepID=UPI0006FA5917|nr:MULTISPECIES: LysR family transcriptional regulator [unclassified Duganella]KQV54277.1 LysR family transcriptional regulator [Duganella sp. Root336D2]KRC03403.1 LysR family transcriptional regulator [Duganella sp. Root198D2]
MNPQRLAIFATIIQSGSISAAAVKLGCGKSVVSRQLAQLEKDLGARLIQRSTRQLALTEVGQLVLEEARQIERSLDKIAHLTDSYQQQVRGLLRVSCSMAGRRVLVPLLADFTALHPQVKISLQLDDAMVDLIAQQIDVAIRTSALVDSTLVARKLAESPSVVCAAPSYLARKGTPRTPQELQQHACLVYAVGARVYDEWNFGEAGTVRVDGPLQMNDGGALVTAAAGGAGIIKVPLPIVADELASGQLLRIMEDVDLPPGPATYAVYPAREFLPLKTAAFVDFLRQRLGAVTDPAPASAA